MGQNGIEFDFITPPPWDKRAKQYFDSTTVVIPIVIRSFQAGYTYIVSGSSGNTVTHLISGNSVNVSQDTTYVDEFKATNTNNNDGRYDSPVTFQVQVRVTVQ